MSESSRSRILRFACVMMAVLVVLAHPAIIGSVASASDESDWFDAGDRADIAEFGDDPTSKELDYASATLVGPFEFNSKTYYVAQYYGAAPSRDELDIERAKYSKELINRLKIRIIPRVKFFKKENGDLISISDPNRELVNTILRTNKARFHAQTKPSVNTPLNRELVDFQKNAISGLSSKITFPKQELSKLTKEKRDRYFAALKLMTKRGTESIIPDEYEKRIKENVKDTSTLAGYADQTASLASELSKRQATLNDAAARRNMKLAAKALRKSSDVYENLARRIKISEYSKSGDQVTAALSIFDLVIRLSESTVYADAKVKRLNRIQEYAASTEGVSLDSGLSDGIERIDALNKNASAPEIAKDIEFWIKESVAGELGTYATEKALKKFVTWKFSQTAASTALVAVAAADVGLTAGGLLTGKNKVWKRFTHAKYSRLAMMEFREVRKHIEKSKRESHLTGERAEVYYSAVYFEYESRAKFYEQMESGLQGTKVDDVLDFIQDRRGEEIAGKLAEDARNNTGLVGYVPTNKMIGKTPTSAEDDAPASIKFTDQTIPSGSSAITIDTAEFSTQAAPDGEFVVVIHKTTEETYGDGIGPKIGESDVLPPGTRQSVEVDLSRTLGPSDDIAELTKSQSLVAMLHRADTTDDDGDNINHGSHITRNGDKVTSRAQVTVSSPPDRTLYTAGFESTPSGETPSDWTASGNSAIRVSNAQAADGTKSLRLSGSSGGCLETVGFGNLGQDSLFTQSTAGSVSFSDRFDDGTLNSQWEGAGIDDPQVTESDGTLNHAVDFNYGSDNNRLQTTQTFDTTGTHRIEMRVRTTQSDYWGYGVALDGTNGKVNLKEHKWEGFNRFVVSGVTDRPDKYSSDYNFYGEFPHKAKLADATSETSFITYSLTVNFDTQTVTEVRRGSKTWDTDLQIKDIGDSYQLRLPTGAGHDVEYDAIAVGPADGEWSLFNDAANEQMPTPTSMSSLSQSMNISFSVRPGGQAQTGCHDHNTGVNLNTGNDGTYGGKNIKLIEFTPDGSVEATFGENTPLGSYDVGTWTDVRVKYTPLKEGQARVAYFIDGEQRETITRGEPSFADQLSYLQVKTGEYTTYVDDINLTTASSGVGDGDVDNPLPTTSLRFTDQTISSGSATLSVDTAQFGNQTVPGEKFVVVVHKTTESTYDDEIGPKIGESDVLSPGTQQSIEVDLSRALGPSDDIAELTKSQSLVAMLHRADTTDDDGDNINHGSHITRNGDKVTSRAQVTVSSPPDKPGAAWTIPMEYPQSQMTTGDVDGDRSAELAVGNHGSYGPSEFGVIEQGQWVWNQSSDAPVHAETVGTVDTDTSPEFIFKSKVSSTWVRPYGIDTSSLWSITHRGWPDTVRAADTDNDGKSEIAAMSHNNGYLTVIDNDGDVTWRTQSRANIERLFGLTEVTGDDTPEILTHSPPDENRQGLQLISKSDTGGVEVVWRAEPNAPVRATLSELDSDTDASEEVIAAYPGRGLITSLDAKTGETRWREQVASADRVRFADVTGDETPEVLLWSDTTLRVFSADSQSLIELSTSAPILRATGSGSGDGTLLLLTEDALISRTAEEELTRIQIDGTQVNEMSVGDTDGDNNPEVALGTGGSLRLYDNLEMASSQLEFPSDERPPASVTFSFENIQQDQLPVLPSVGAALTDENNARITQVTPSVQATDQISISYEGQATPFDNTEQRPGVEPIRFIDIQTENLSDSTFVNNTIEFSVAKPTLQNLPNAGANDVELYQYNATTGQYEPLSTSAPTDNGQDFRYTATYPGVDRDLMVGVEEAEPETSVQPDSVTAPDTATAGDTVEITATVENTGQESGDITLDLIQGGTTVDSASVTVSAASTQTVSVSTELAQTGAQTVTVEGPQNSASVTVAVEEPQLQVDVDPSDLPGDGTESDPYEITNVSELQTMEDDLDANYELVSDIDASNTAQFNNGSGFDPIGGSSFVGNTPSEFMGSLDGNNHTVTGLIIDRQNESRIGLFGVTRSGATVSNITLTDLTVTGDTQVGGLVGKNSGAIQNATVSGGVTGTEFVGGLVANNLDATITDASAAGSVAGTNRVGGLVGRNIDGTIQNATASMSVTGKGSAGGLVEENSGGTIRNAAAIGNVNVTGEFGSAGGLVAENKNGNITNATASGSVTGDQNVGGLVAENKNGNITNATASGSVAATGEFGSAGGFVELNDDGTITNATASGSVTGSEAAGGFVALNDDGTITNVTASGSVSGGDEVGGLAGSNSGTITDASASGTVTHDGEFGNVGGLVGFNGNTIQDTFAVGSVTGESNVGGLAGGNSGTIEQSYFDTQATGQTTSAGTATGLTTAQMQGQAAESNMSGFDFENTWTTTSEYPALRALSETDEGSSGSGPIPPASVTFSNQTVSNGSTIITVDAAKFGNQSVPGEEFVVVVHDTTDSTYGGEIGAKIGESPILSGETQQNITVNLSQTLGSNDTIVELTSSQSLVAMLHRANTTDADSANHGAPILRDGSPITGRAQITMSPDDEELLSVPFNTTFETGLSGWTVNQRFRTGDRREPGAGTYSQSILSRGDGEYSDQYDGSVRLGVNFGGPSSIGVARNISGIQNGTQISARFNSDSLSGEAGRVRLLLYPPGEGNQNEIGLDGRGGRTDADEVVLSGTVSEDYPPGTQIRLTADAWPGEYDIYVTNISAQSDQTSSESSMQVNVSPSDLPGNGTSGDPYEISNVSELQAMEDDLDANYELVSDIDASYTGQLNNGSGFDPVGGADSIERNPPEFTGSFEGNNQTITDLTITRPDEVSVGLFGAIDGATLSNVTLENVIVTGDRNVGGLVGFNSGTIRTATASGSVNGDRNVGGLVGNNYGPIQNATASVSVNGGFIVGGLVGQNNFNNRITDASASGNVTGRDRNVGGLVGRNFGIVQNATASGSVTGRDRNVGGLVGLNDGSIDRSVGSIRNSFAVGPVSGEFETVGGLVGSTDAGTTQQSYFDINTTGQDASAGSAIGLTTAQMQGQAARTNMSGLAFGTTWQIQSTDYPALIPPEAETELSLENLSVASQGTEAEILVGTKTNVSVNVTNVGEITENVTLSVGVGVDVDAESDTDTSAATLTESVSVRNFFSGTTEQIVFDELNTSELPAREEPFNITVSASTATASTSASDSVTGNLTISSPPSPPASITFSDQIVSNGSSTLTVENATFGNQSVPGEEFVVVVHKTNSDGGEGEAGGVEIGAKIGESPVLPGTQTNSNIIVNLSKQVTKNDDVAKLTESQQLIAMLHRANQTETETETPNHGVAITRNGTRVTDDAEITIGDRELLIQQPSQIDRGESFAVEVLNSSESGVAVSGVTVTLNLDSDTENQTNTTNASGIAVFEMPSAATTTTEVITLTASPDGLPAYATGDELTVTGIRDPGDLILENLSVTPTELPRNNSGTVAGEITNTNQTTLSQTLTLTANNTGTLLTQTVTVPGNTTQQFSLTPTFSTIDTQTLSVNGKSAGTVTVTELTPPTPELETPQLTPSSNGTDTSSSVDLPAEVNATRDANVTVPLTNRGDEPGEFTLNLTVADDDGDGNGDVSPPRTRTRTLEVNATQTQTVTFGGVTEGLSAQPTPYTVTVTATTTTTATESSRNTSLTTNLSIIPSTDAGDDDGSLQITDTRSPARVSDGERFTVSARVGNFGANVTTDELRFAVDTDRDGNFSDETDTLQTQTRTLPANDSARVAFQATAPNTDSDSDSDSGQPPLTFRLSTDADTVTGNLSVVSTEFTTAVSTGDPHIVSFDGVAYDFQAAGEFVLAREPTPNGSLIVQARQEPLAGSDSITRNTAVATVLDNTTVIIDATDPTPLQINGSAVELTGSETIAVGNGTITRTQNSNTLTITYPGQDDTAGIGDERLTVDLYGDRVDIALSLDPDRDRPVEGIFGPADGNATNDIGLPNGTALAQPPQAKQLYGVFRQSWRVNNSTTLFAYEDDNGPETYYDPTIPAEAISLADLDQTTRQAAEQQAVDAGLQRGTVAFRNAVLDVALTDDGSYLTSAQQQNTSVETTTVVGTPTESTLRVEPASASVTPGETTKLNLTLERAPEGLAGYNLTVSVDISVAATDGVSVADATAPGIFNNSVSETTIGAANQTVEITAADIKTVVEANATDIPLGSITVAADETADVSEVPVTVSVSRVIDDTGSRIDVKTQNATVSVTEQPPLAEGLAPPTDPDDDGIFEDVNGNGRLDFNDVVVFFENLRDAEAPFQDLNENGRIEFDDIVELFQEI